MQRAVVGIMRSLFERRVEQPTYGYSTNQPIVLPLVKGNVLTSREAIACEPGEKGMGLVRQLSARFSSQNERALR